MSSVFQKLCKHPLKRGGIFNSRIPFLSSSTNRILSFTTSTECLNQIKDIELRAKCRVVVDALLVDSRVYFPFNEYMELCSLNGLDSVDGKELSSAMHKCGLIWYFDEYFDKKEPLLIKTKEATKHFASILDLNGDTRAQFTREKQEELKEKLLEIGELEGTHAEIENKARLHAKRVWTGIFGYIVVHCAAVPWLTFWQYSWDVMEPVTYMFNLWGLFIATWFYLRTQLDFTNEGINEALIRLKRNKLYKKYKFDAERYEELRGQIGECQDDLMNVEWAMLKKVHPGIPDPLRSLHLSPKQLLEKYADELKIMQLQDEQKKKVYE